MNPAEKKHRDSLAKMRQNLSREHDFISPADIEGDIPSWLRGTMYRNGPALSERFGRAYAHAFEGDGAINAVRFSEQGPEVAVKLVRTKEFLEEEARKRQLYGFAVPWSRRILNVLRGKGKIPSNVNVMLWQDRVFALPEGGAPVEIDRDSFSTIDTEDFHDVLTGYHSPHPHYIASRNASYNFRLLWGKQTELSIFELPQQGKAKEITRIPIDGAIYLHDFVATPNHLIFFVNPVRINILRAITRIGPFTKIFRWEPDLGTQIIVVPIDNPGEPLRIDAPAFYVWHHANAFEEGDELFIDYAHWNDFSSFEVIGDSEGTVTSPPRLARACINLTNRSFTQSILSELEAEFPSVASAGTNTRSGWLFAQHEIRGKSGLLTFDTRTNESQTFAFEAGKLASEPIFVPKPGGVQPHDGALVTLVYDPETHRSFYAVFDAMDLAKGPEAKIWFDHHIPMTFHGLWVPQN